MQAGTKPVYLISARTVAMDMLAIGFFWCISLAVVNPLGNFPLNDDWSYGRAVYHLLKYGDFHPTGWTSMPLITQALWGSLFSIPAGFSFNALRFSTLAASLLVIFASYLVVRELRQPRWLAVVVALTLAFNPVYYALSYTFMTDVPFAAISLFTAYFLLRHLGNGSDMDWLAGTVLAVAAVLDRQLALAVPLAFAVTLILKDGITVRSMVRAAIPPALCIGAIFFFRHWLVASGRLPVAYDFQSETMLHVFANPSMLIQLLARNIYVCLLYLGWFLLPALMCIAGVWRAGKGKAVAILASSSGVLAVWGWLLAKYSGLGKTMPLSGNIIVNSGIGPLTLRDTYILNLGHVAALPGSFWWVITGMSLFGAALLITTAFAFPMDRGEVSQAAKMSYSPRTGGIFLLLCAAIYLLPLLAVELHDRYFVPVIPFIAAGIASFFSAHSASSGARLKAFRVAGMGVLASLMIFAIFGTRDYMAWNRVRWTALGDLMRNANVSAADIDGGFEFNGWYFYDPWYVSDPGKSWWWVQGNRYQIGFQGVPGYKLVKEYKYSRWLPPGEGRIVVSEKDASVPGR